MKVIIETTEHYKLALTEGKRQQARVQTIERDEKSDINFDQWVREIPDELFTRWQAVQKVYDQIQEEIDDLIYLAKEDQPAKG